MIPRVKPYKRQLWLNGKRIGPPCYVLAPTPYLAKLNHAYSCIFDHTEYCDKVTYTASKLSAETLRKRGIYVS